MANKLEPKIEGTSGACNVCKMNVTWVKKTWQGKDSLMVVGFVVQAQLALMDLVNLLLQKQ